MRDGEREREREIVSGVNKAKSASVTSSQSVCLVGVRNSVEGGVDPYFTQSQCYCVPAMVTHVMGDSIIQPQPEEIVVECHGRHYNLFKVQIQDTGTFSCRVRSNHWRGT